MGAIGTLIRELREERGWSQEHVAVLMGLGHQNQVSKRERGEIAVKPPERKKWAELFEMKLEEFDARWRASKVHDRPAPKGIPVINRGPAGVVYPYDHDQFASGEYHDAMEYLDRGDITDDLAFALIIVGDSMEPTLYEGDRAVFTPATVSKPSVKLENGRVVFVRFTPESGRDGVTIARWFEQPDRKVQLVKDNRKYPPLLVDAAEFAQVAVCVEWRSKRGL